MKKILALLVPVLFIAVSCKSTKTAANTSDSGKLQPLSKVERADKKKAEQTFLDALKAKLIDDNAEALKLFQEAVNLDANNAAAHYELANLYLRSGQVEPAKESAKKALALDPANKWYVSLYTDILVRTDPKEAVKTLEAAIKQFPNESDFYTNLAYLYLQLKSPADALRVYDQYEKVFGIDEGIVNQKKNIYLQTNQFDKAIAELKKLEELYPNEPEVMMMRAELYTANNMAAKANEVYNEILKIDPDNAQALLGVADYSSRSGDTAVRKENVRKIFANPNIGVEAKVKILFPYLQYFDAKKENKTEALDLSEILVKTHPNEAMAYSIRGDVLSYSDKTDEAIIAYNKALSLKTDVFAVWQQLFFLYNQKQQWDTLLKLTTEAQELYPNQAMVYLFKGISENQLKKYEQAIKSYSRGEKMTSSDPKMRAQFLSNIGDVFHTQKRFDESDSIYNEALKYDPDNATVLNNFSYYLSLRKKDLEHAKQMSSYANKLVPDNDSYLDTYAWILFQLEDYKGAKEFQEKAMKSGGDKSGTILEHYGDILSKLGEKESALEYWRKAKVLGVDSPALQRKIDEGKYVE
jgi:tetratricopeptide (TPR) repeat protein